MWAMEGVSSEGRGEQGCRTSSSGPAPQGGGPQGPLGSQDGVYSGAQGPGHWGWEDSPGHWGTGPWAWGHGALGAGGTGPLGAGARALGAGGMGPGRWGTGPWALGVG